MAPGCLIWKTLSDLQIKLFICELVFNISNVLAASATDAMCPQGRYRKIKLQTLSVIDIRNSSVTHVLKPIRDVLVASLTSLALLHQ